MADIIELNQWENGIYQLETEDPVLGGVDGIDNLQAKQLANRTKYLKEQVELRATIADVAAQIASLVDSSPAALDTLNELAAALGDDANFASTITNAVALKAPWSALDPIIVEGGLTPDHATLTQLRDAIKNIAKDGDYKDSVRVASTAAINLAAPGANIDGIAMVAGDRFLEKDNATLANRGIYIWNGAAVPATRALDADTGAELNGGAIIPVEEGTVNADTNWQVTNDGVITIGTTGLTFQQLGAQNFASNAEAQGLAVNNKAITPATLAAALQGSNQSLASNGYQKLPGGLIFQWANENVAANTGAIVFPIAFPNAVVALTFGDITGGVTQSVTIASSVPTPTGFTFFSSQGATGVNVGTFRYIAIGY